ncbi:MAG: carboxypeptidase-like regulatory domain-containing protein [Bacteroidota bacterium]|nr:carboxypeptidase-like regulatory domain-containing protein [Bacteroidota bacterium]MDP4244839.1 carboxypeptidase-like regulatory domain-containing protein [Bacteroidota bacterium]
MSMSTSDKYHHFSTRDIQKYLAGELSAAEMHALERAAMEDPLLSDALEGMESDFADRGASGVLTDLQELETRLNHRVANKKEAVVVPLYRAAWWKIAAAILLVAGMSVLSYRYLFSGRDNANDKAGLAARTEPKPVPRTDSQAATATNAPPGTEPAQESKSLPGAATVPDARPAQENKTSTYPHTTAPLDKQAQVYQYKAAPPAAYAASEGMKSDLAKGFSKPSPADSIRLSFTPTANYVADSLRSGNAGIVPSFNFKAKNAGAPVNRNAPENNATNYVFIGKVIDSNNRPIPFATISINNHRQTANTDHNGNFSFQLLGSPDSLAPVMVSSLGYHSAKFTLNAYTPGSGNASSNVVRLQPEDHVLDEGVTIGYGTQRKAMNKRIGKDDSDKDNFAGVAREAENENKVVQHAAPVIGWTAYQYYLRKNQPFGGIDSSIKGNEIISFRVDRKGRLSAFKVEQSLSAAHDTLLIRLVRQGPAWKSLEGNKGGANVTMSF